MIGFSSLSLRPVPRNAGPLLFYSILIFLIYFADGIMSYVSPVIIEAHVSSTLIMGMIIATSSVIGLVCDMVFPFVFKAKQNNFFLTGTVIIALLFPLSYLVFPKILPTFFLGMAIWGIYFEFLIFSNFLFIHAFIRREHHAFAWGLIGVFRSIGMLVSPAIASLLLHLHPTYPLYTALMLLVSALLGLVLFERLYPTGKSDIVKPIVAKTYGFLHELRTWPILVRKIWTIYALMFMLYLLESTFFTVGVLLSEEMTRTSVWGYGLIAAYLLPALLTGLAVERITLRFGKKRTAFFCGLVGGIFLTLTYRISEPGVLVFSILVSSMFTSLSLPALLGTIQDYVERLDKYGGDMVGLQNSAGSLAYIIGPVVASAIAISVGNRQTLGVMGVLLGAVSLCGFLFTPRKIRLPQHELSLLDASGK
jgi:MFS family permease